MSTEDPNEQTTGEDEDEAHGGQGSEERGIEGDAQVGTGENPGVGGYGDRDPESDMPSIPTAPETHDGADD